VTSRLQLIALEGIPLVEPGDEKALAEKLSLLLSDEALRERIGKSAREFVSQFSPEAIAREWEQIYTEVSNRHSAPRH